MPRELRKRTARLNYAELLRSEDEDDAGPSHEVQRFDEEADSGSDFAPEVVEGNDEDAEAEDDDGLSDVNFGDEAQSPERERSVPPVRAARSTKAAPRRSVTLAPSISVGRQAMGSHIPSLHHRHRAIPIYNRRGSVERLSEAPSLFTEPQIVPTRAWGSNDIVTGRVNKAWGYNVGRGPLWELIEDRGWFKESKGFDDESESGRRPKVHQTTQVVTNLEVLSRNDAESYLPSSATVKCSFGPFGKQELVETSRFDTLRLNKFFPETQSHVFNAGAPVWGLDWCPIHPDDRPDISFKQYLAVGPTLSQSYSPAIGVKAARPAPACVQIWSFGPSSESAEEIRAQCDMVLCVENGPAHELRWCPLPSHGSLQKRNNKAQIPRNLGLLAGTFEDGSLCVYAVPYPPDVAKDNEAADGPVYVRLPEPLLRFELEDTSCWCLDWANSEVIAAGCTNGAIAVWNVKEALNKKQSNPSEPILPTHYFSTHQCAIRSVAWIRAPVCSAHAELCDDDPTVIVGSGYDGLVSATDIREPYGNEVYRTRDIVNTVCYSTYSGGPISVDQGQVKVNSFAPVMLNKGHTLLDPDGPAWSMHASDYHPQLAVGVTDGSCITTNTLRTTRRGGAVPFLMHKIYQMDYSRNTREHRMLENIVPKEIDRTAGIKAVKPATKGSGAWPPEVGVQRVVWNNGNGLANAPLLASATGSGLCRIDWLLGKWLKDKVPYYGIEGIRAERDTEGDEMDEDSD